MPYNPSEFFEVGRKLGQTKGAATRTAVGGVMDMFKQAVENQMKLQQTAELFKSEHQWEIEHDPEKRMAQEALNLMPKSGQPQSTGVSSPSSGLVFSGITGGKPTFKNIEAESQEAAAKHLAEKTAEIDLSKKEFREQLDSFKQIDDLVPRGSGLGRFKVGAKNFIAGLKQDPDNPVGAAIAMHDNARQQLRVKVARVLGNVGNLNIQEQTAAQAIIPDKFDSEQLKNLKRAYLDDIGRAVDSNEPGAVKVAIQKLMKDSNVFKSNVIQQSAASKLPRYQVGQVIEHEGKKYKVKDISDPEDPDMEPL